MFVREKTVNGYTYLYLVENVREDGRTKQRIIRNLGRKDAVLAAGDLDRLLASVGRFARQSIILGAQGEDGARVEARRIGGSLLFGRLWQRLGVSEVLEELLAGRQFGFAVERAVFVATLHRLFVSGSDRNCADWMESYLIEGSEGLALHHFYRAMAWLGEEIAPKAEGALAPRCVKDVIEEQLFERRRDLFTDLSLVFMDTTSLSFYGAGGETLGARGHSKDHRPDLAQMILALVIDAEGRPICTEMVPGNTADVTILLPVVARLRERFGGSLPRFDLMAQLDRHPEGLKMRELSERLMVTGGNVTGLTDRLVAEGLVERRDDPDDRRACTVCLTREGRRQFRVMAREHERWVATLFEGLDAGAQAELFRLLGLLKRALPAAPGPEARRRAARAAPPPPTDPA